MNQTQLEESLATQAFDPKVWLGSHLDLSAEKKLELELTDFSFNLNLLQQTLENRLLTGQISLEKSLVKISEQLPTMSEAYAQLDDLGTDEFCHEGDHS